MNSENSSISGSATVGAAEELQQNFNGRILFEGDVEYDKERQIWNGMIDRKPRMIAQCVNTSDIQNAVKFAKKNNLLISVRGGGHNVSGNAVCDDGIMIDLSRMKGIQVDVVRSQAMVEMGVTWAEFDAETQKSGLATTGGVIGTTGIAGLTLGGGVGWLVRKHGLSCDNIIEAEVVTAAGETVKTSLSANPDLLWGIRGGGGNFGIVTSLTMRLHKVSTVLGGMILHSRDKANEVLRFYRDFMETAPEELTLYAALLHTPDGIPVVGLVGCYSGDLETAEDVLRPLRNFGTPIVDLIQPMPYVHMQALMEGAFPHGNRYYWKSGFFEALTDEAIDVIVDQVNQIPSPFSATILEYYGGVSLNEPEGGAAFPHRDAKFDLVIISNWPDKTGDEANIAWTRQIWEAVQPYFSHKVYVNMLGGEGEERVKEAYGTNYQRLVELKQKYDPTNLFRMNQNIKPGNS